jgi:hypothetical protein
MAPAMTRTAPLPPPATGLRLTAGIVGGFGVLMLLATLPPGNAVFSWLTDHAFWPPDGAEGLADPGARLLLAISGGMALGFGVLFWGLGGPGTDPAAVRRLALRSLGVWFVADSLFSVVVGAWPNVLGNVGFLALAAWPLRRTGA